MDALVPGSPSTLGLLPIRLSIRSRLTISTVSTFGGRRACADPSWKSEQGDAGRTVVAPGPSWAPSQELSLFINAPERVRQLLRRYSRQAFSLREVALECSFLPFSFLRIWYVSPTEFRKRDLEAKRKVRGDEGRPSPAAVSSWHREHEPRVSSRFTAKSPAP